MRDYGFVFNFCLVVFLSFLSVVLVFISAVVIHIVVQMRCTREMYWRK
jgi:hypothetical protein